MADIYLLIEGKQEGPYSEEQVRQSLSEGLIPVDLPAWHEGLADWVQVEGLIKSASTTPLDDSGVMSPSNDELSGHPASSEMAEPVVPTKVTSDAKKRSVNTKYVALSAAAIFLVGLSIAIGIYLVSSHRSSTTVQASGSQTEAGSPWENSMGMKFVPAGTPGVLFCIWDVRVKDYAAFVKETGRDWPKPVFSDVEVFNQTENDPVANASWDDAHAFCDWLTTKERSEGKLSASQAYRLPTDSEWSKAVGLEESTEGTPADKNSKIKDVYPWGNQWPPPNGAGNYDGEDFDSDLGIKGYRDGYKFTSPVGTFTANQFGLYDMGGNEWQWCEDKYDGDEADGRVLRGGSYINGYHPEALLSSCRLARTHDTQGFGFRLVLGTSDASNASNNQGGVSSNYGKFSKDLIVTRLKVLGFDDPVPMNTGDANNDQSSLKTSYNNVNVGLVIDNKTGGLLQATVSVNLTPSDQTNDPDSFNKTLSIFGNTVSAITLDVLSTDEFNEMTQWHQQGFKMENGDPTILEAHRSKGFGKLSIDSDWSIVSTGSAPVVFEQLGFTIAP